MTTPQELVEHALATSTSNQCIAIARASTAANLRWANNTLTTNGVMQGAGLTVIAFHDRPEGVAAASVSGSATTREQVAALVESADAAAALADPAEDANPLVDGRVSDDWENPPAETSIRVFDTFAPELGEVFGRSQDRVHYGFVSHDVVTTYVGSSTGLRLRHEQPSGYYGWTGKSSDLSRSAWVGGQALDFDAVSATALDDELVRRLRWAERRIDLQPGRHDTILPPTSVADLMIYAYWSAGARVAHEGQSVFSSRSGGTRVGEQVARDGVRLLSDPTHPGIEAAPFVIASSSGNTSSVFDNGLPLAATDWIAD
ncbi:MAG: metallopeptidase TldD-related protein, partial [Nocardioides sp.]|nr:metallopeptidase TldD-related protein [Nocardioides sp.]